MPLDPLLQSLHRACRCRNQEPGFSGRILGSTARFTGNLALVLTIIAVTACTTPLSPATPSPMPTPTPSPTPSPAVKEALEELFWISVDWVGKASNTPRVNRTLDFETAKPAVIDFLLTLYFENFKTLEGYGIIPDETFPYCIDIISGIYRIAALPATSSPSEAAPHVDQAIGDIHRVAMVALEIPHEAGRGRHDKPFCDKFEAEKREVMGLPPLDGQ